MTRAEALALLPGLYRVRWKGDPDRPSLAAVGMREDGTRWLAPCNWIAPAEETSPWWRGVLTMERIEAELAWPLRVGAAYWAGDYRDVVRVVARDQRDPGRCTVRRRDGARVANYPAYLLRHVTDADLASLGLRSRRGQAALAGQLGMR